MASLVRRFAACLSLGGIAFAFSVGANAADDKKEDISTIMKKSFGKKDPLQKKVKSALKDAKWDDVTTAAKEWKEHADKLAANDPPKGDKKSWEKLSKAFADNVTTIGTAAEKKDGKAAGDAVKKIDGSCKTCHDAHKE